MLGRNIAWSMVALGVASTMWACGSDGDDSTATTGGDSGASAAAGGHAAGAAGHSAGSGGTTAQGGTSTGGNATAGQGDALGGEGGALFGAGGWVDQGGAGVELAQGGEGGAPTPTPTPTLADNCATICGEQTGLSCNYGSACVQGCTGTADPDFGTAFPEEYLAMIACQAKQLTALQYECSSQMTTLIQPAPTAGTACEALICKFTCDDGMYVDDNAVARCCQ